MVEGGFPKLYEFIHVAIFPFGIVYLKKHTFTIISKGSQPLPDPHFFLTLFKKGGGVKPMFKKYVAHFV